MNYTKRPLTVGDIVIYVDLAIVPIAYIVMAVGSFMCMEWPSQKPTAITLEETLHILRDDIKSKYDSGYSVREAPRIGLIIQRKSLAMLPWVHMG